MPGRQLRSDSRGNPQMPCPEVQPCQAEVVDDGAPFRAWVAVALALAQFRERLINQ